MNWLNAILILAAAYLAVFCQAAFQGLRHLVGAQPDLLPALMVYASLSAGLPAVALLAVFGGLGFDSLSANPLGVSVLPLFAIDLPLYIKRELILRDEPFAQFVLGLAASAAAPFLTLVVLLTAGHKPLLGWGSIWQWLVMSIGGAAATPAWFALFAWLHRALVHSAATQSSFRPDREIRRGR
jgi:rod shape-determining protein MreD